MRCARFQRTGAFLMVALSFTFTERPSWYSTGVGCIVRKPSSTCRRRGTIFWTPLTSVRRLEMRKQVPVRPLRHRSSSFAFTPPMRSDS